MNAERLIDERDREMERLGVETLDLDHLGSRYFVHAYETSPAVRQFLLSDLMAQIAEATLGENVYLFNEQYVVKAAERGMKFGWHQDSGFIPYAHQPYLTCWIALDDVTEANGTVYLLPYSRAGTRDVVEHVRDEETNDLIGYFGDDPGEPVIVPAGSIAASRARSFTAAAPTRPTACVASTSRSTRPSRSSMTIARDRGTSPSRSRPTAARIATDGM